MVLRLEVPDRIDHLPGQHYVIRLTADDGYVAQRSYSVASPPSDPLLEFYIERLDDGEVSTFLADVVEVGDELDVRGPIGGWFVWTADQPGVRRRRRIGRRAAGGDAAACRGAWDGRSCCAWPCRRARVSTCPYGDELIAAGALIALTREDVPRIAPRRG